MCRTLGQRASAAGRIRAGQTTEPDGPRPPGPASTNAADLALAVAGPRAREPPRLRHCVVFPDKAGLAARHHTVILATRPYDLRLNRRAAPPAPGRGAFCGGGA